MLDVMEELDAQRDRPPSPFLDAGEPLAQDEQPHEHDERVSVVQRLRLDDPGEEVSEDAAGLGHRPPERIDLKGLR